MSTPRYRHSFPGAVFLFVVAVTTLVAAPFLTARSSSNHSPAVEF